MKNILHQPFIRRIRQAYFSNIYGRDVLIIHELIGDKRIEATDSSEIEFTTSCFQ